VSTIRQLKDSILEKRPIPYVNHKGVIFHYDNAKPHTAKKALHKLKKLK